MLTGAVLARWAVSLLAVCVPVIGLAVSAPSAAARGAVLVDGPDGSAVSVPGPCTCPGDWAAADERRELAGIPDEIMFATKPELAGRLLQHAHDLGIRAGFVAGDEVCGGPGLRRSIRERGAGYVLAVRSNYQVTVPSGRRLTVKKAADLVKPAMWQRMRTGQPVERRAIFAKMRATTSVRLG